MPGLFIKEPQILSENCIHAGKIIKTNGKEQKVICRFDNEDNIDFENLEMIFIEIQGLLVPFFIDELSLKNNGTATMILRHLDSEAKSEQISGRRVFIGKDLDKGKKHKQYEQHHFNGYRVCDINHGDLGTIYGLIDYSGNHLFKIVNNDSEILIPITDAYIRNIDKKKKIIELETPEGLIELNR